jgi:hypothetical protein
LRQLLPEIVRLAHAQSDGSERERQLIQVIARVVEAELKFRADNPE